MNSPISNSPSASWTRRFGVITLATTCVLSTALGQDSQIGTVYRSVGIAGPLDIEEVVVGRFFAEHPATTAFLRVGGEVRGVSQPTQFEHVFPTALTGVTAMCAVAAREDADRLVYVDGVGLHVAAWTQGGFDDLVVPLNDAGGTWSGASKIRAIEVEFGGRIEIHIAATTPHNPMRVARFDGSTLVDVGALQGPANIFDFDWVQWDADPSPELAVYSDLWFTILDAETSPSAVFTAPVQNIADGFVRGDENGVVHVLSNWSGSWLVSRVWNGSPPQFNHDGTVVLDGETPLGFEVADVDEDSNVDWVISTPSPTRWVLRGSTAGMLTGNPVEIVDDEATASSNSLPNSAIAQVYDADGDDALDLVSGSNLSAQLVVSPQLGVVVETHANPSVAAVYEDSQRIKILGSHGLDSMLDEGSWPESIADVDNEVFSTRFSSRLYIEGVLDDDTQLMVSSWRVDNPGAAGGALDKAEPVHVFVMSLNTDGDGVTDVLVPLEDHFPSFSQSFWPGQERYYCAFQLVRQKGDAWKPASAPTWTAAGVARFLGEGDQGTASIVHFLTDGNHSALPVAFDQSLFSYDPLTETHKSLAALPGPVGNRWVGVRVPFIPKTVVSTPPDLPIPMLSPSTTPPQ